MSVADYPSGLRGSVAPISRTASPVAPDSCEAEVDQISRWQQRTDAPGVTRIQSGTCASAMSASLTMRRSPRQKAARCRRESIASVLTHHLALHGRHAP